MAKINPRPVMPRLVAQLVDDDFMRAEHFNLSPQARREAAMAEAKRAVGMLSERDRDDVQSVLTDDHWGPLRRPYPGATIFYPDGVSITVGVKFDVIEQALAYLARGYAVLDPKHQIIARIDVPHWRTLVQSKNVKKGLPPAHVYRRYLTDDIRRVPAPVAERLPLSRDMNIGYLP